jgi:predicted amidophosphoribosyltransferase
MAGPRPNALTWAGHRLAPLADLVWPVSCGGCERLGERWCADCAPTLAGAAGPTSPSPRPPGLPPVWAVTSYGGCVRQAVVRWKDEGRHDLTRVLADGLAASVLAALSALSGLTGPADGILWLVPMPSRPAARRSRGGDPVRELAVRAARRVRAGGRGVRALPALRHLRAVADQAGLDAAGRAANVHGALGVRSGARARLSAAPCLLVDDVVTTGATLAEAAAAVVRAGGHPIGAAVVAATRRTGGADASAP